MWKFLKGVSAAVVLAALLPLANAQSTVDPPMNTGGSSANTRADEGAGVIRLRDQGTDTSGNGRRNQNDDTAGETPARYVPGEFELFVNQLAGTATTFQKPLPQPQSEQRTDDRRSGQSQSRDGEESLLIRRFGAELVTGYRGIAQDYAPQVPPDYLVSPGDELVLAMWGAVDANLRLTVDRAGRITIPRVGAVMVSGVRYADLANVIRQQVAQVFKNFQLSVSLGQLRNIRIYVTGFTSRPGSYTVSSLSTIVNALMRTGGPSAAGSFRNVELYRAGKLVTTFDLYDLLLRGDKSADRVLQAEDVIRIGPVGPQVALIGSVNKPAIFELRENDTIADVLQMAAGFTAVADRSRLAVERLADRETVRVAEVFLPAGAGQKPSSGEVLRAFSMVDNILPIQRQNKRVQIEGEVVRPGHYILPSGSTITDAIQAAGGLTGNAYLFGTEFTRESVRVRQQENYDRALRDMETEFTRATTTQRALSADEAQAQGARSTGLTRLIERLRAVRPTGRIVLQMSPEAPTLPQMALEDGDRVYVPARPTTVGVFGSVFNAGSFLFDRDRSIEDYLRFAGGATRGADTGSTFVLRANGTVVSSRQRNGWFGLGASLGDLKAEPGDTVFVPEEANKTTFAQEAKEWTQILYQFGLGAAALKTLRGD